MVNFKIPPKQGCFYSQFYSRLFLAEHKVRTDYYRTIFNPNSSKISVYVHSVGVLRYARLYSRSQ